MTAAASVFRVLTALWITLALIPAPAGAGTGGKILGVVKDATSGAELPGTNIALAGTELETTADEKGRFFILNVPAAPTPSGPPISATRPIPSRTCGSRPI